jgi:hypothetical protein
MSCTGISVLWAGNWANNKTYRKNQAVFYNGSSYRANKTTTQEPSITATDWELIAQAASSESNIIGLDDLTDVALSSPNPGDILIYDSTASTWKNQSTSTLGLATSTDLTDHIDDTSNPHSVTATQVGKDTAQWNADKIKGVVVDDSNKANGKILKFNSTTNTLEYADDLVGGGGSGSGETNTASNVGVGGVGVFKQKIGVNLEFKNINAGSNKITITDDTTNSEVDIDINESNLAVTSNLSSHVTNTSNPHSVTAAQVGNSTAQWNANKLQGVDVHTTTPTNGQVLAYNSTNTRYEPVTPGGGGVVLQTVHFQGFAFNASGNVNNPTVGGTSVATWFNSNLVASITPISSISVIQIIGTLNCVKSNALASNYFDVRVSDGGSVNSRVCVNVGRRADAYPEQVAFNIRVNSTGTTIRTFTVQVLLYGINFNLSLGTLCGLTLMEIQG